MAYRNGIMVSDSQIQAGGIITGSARKILKTKDGILVGAAGNLSSIASFLNWWEDETEDKPSLTEMKLENLGGLIVLPDKTVLHFEEAGYPMEIKNPFHAIGVGAEIAFGAFEKDATAEEAVRAAIKWSPNCGGKIQKVSL